MRIASLQPSISLTLAHLGRLDALCAVTRYCLQAVPELAALNLPVLADAWSFDKDRPGQPGNIDTLLASRPDLVLASVPYRPESLAAILKCGLPVLTLAPKKLEDVFLDILLIGRQVDALPTAEALVQTMRATLAETHVKASAKPQRTVYCEEWGNPLIHSQPWVAELAEACGGQFLGVPGKRTTAEEIAALDPDVLFFAWCGAGDRVPLARVIEQRGWQHLRAVRERQVFCIPDQHLNTPSYNLLDGLACLASGIHPEIFGDHPELIQLA